MIVSQLIGEELSSTAHTARTDEARLIAALRRGEEAAFVELVEQYNNALLRMALLYVPSRSVAEEVVQDTWLGVLQGIGRFEGRSALKTWLFRILINRAQMRGKRESRCIPFSTLEQPGDESAEPAVEAARFFPPEHAEAGRWISTPQTWDSMPESRLLTRETYDAIEAAIAALPASQRAVISLRDIEGWSSVEVCNVFGISETNQRVLLHRARAKVRQALERYLEGS